MAAYEGPPAGFSPAPDPTFNDLCAPLERLPE